MEAIGAYLFNVSYKAFSCLNGPSEMPNRRFGVINQIEADEIGPMVGQRHPKGSFST